MKRASTTSILSQNNNACNGTNKIGQKCHFITLHNSVFFQVECKQSTSAKMHKIFIAQKSYCACCVLSLVTIRSKYYFNFILNRTRWGRELFDRPSYYPVQMFLVFFCYSVLLLIYCWIVCSVMRESSDVCVDSRCRQRVECLLVKVCWSRCAGRNPNRDNSSCSTTFWFMAT